MKSRLYLLLAFLITFPGCLDGLSGFGNKPADTSSELSLNDIGEKAIEKAEDLEDEGLYLGALESYQRAGWAFTYYKTLTGRTPVYMREAEYGVKRMEEQLRSKNTK